MEQTSWLQKLKYILLTTVFLELFLGGTGRLIELNSFLTLRMCLFLLYFLLIVIYYILGRKLPIEVLIIILFFITLTVLSAITGYLNGAVIPDIFEDIKPLLNIFLLCYLAFSIKKIGDINYMIKLLKISAILLAVFHVVLYCIYLQYSDISILYNALNSAENNNTVFLFKGDSGFINYTGDIYLCVGFIIWEQYNHIPWEKYTAIVLIAIAIVLTGTRGLIIALAAVYFIKWFILKFNYKSLIYMTIAGVLVLGVYLNIKDSIGDKDESDQTRYEQISEVKSSITPLSTIIGHGYGIGVPIRPIHMEISFLEIFHKQGVLGLTYYFTIWFIAYRAFKRAEYKNSVGFYLCVLFIFFVSVTNPYVNHPLGITVLAISIISMLKLREFEDTGELEILK